VHARYSYLGGDILWGQRFVDILERSPNGTLSIDYTHFDDVVPSDISPSVHATGVSPPE
jgi:hypothetical protein